MSWHTRIRKARSIVRRHGPLVLVTAAFRRYVVDHREFYLYERPLEQWPEDAFRPELDEFEAQFIADNEQADRVAEQHDDFRLLSHRARQALGAGAVAFCVYSGREPVHVGWIATSPGARASIDPLRFEVPFDRGVAWTGAVWTSPAQRGRGLMKYSNQRRMAFLLHHGFTASRGAVERRNYPSQRAVLHFEPHIYAVGVYWRALGRRFWSERRLRRGDAFLSGESAAAPHTIE